MENNDQLCNSLKIFLDDRLYFYKNQCEAMENLVESFNLDIEIVKELKAPIQNRETGIDELTLHRHKLCNLNLQNLLKFYAEENHRLAINLDSANRQLNKSKEDSFNVLSKEKLLIKLNKTKQYEKECVKIRKKNPLLNDSKYDPLSIKRETDHLDSLRQERAQLEASLAKYRGLKPSVIEAKKQLEQFKIECSKIHKILG